MKKLMCIFAPLFLTLSCTAEKNLKKSVLVFCLFVASAFSLNAQRYGYGQDGSRFNHPKGYYGLIEMQVPTVFVGSSAVGVDLVNGYRLCPQFAIGGGFGFEGNVADKAFQLPVFLHLRSDFLDYKVSPYLAMNVGYNFQIGAEDQMGFFVKPQLGISYNVGAFRMTSGVDFKCTRGEIYDSTLHGNRSIWWLGLFGLNVGLEF